MHSPAGHPQSGPQEPVPLIPTPVAEPLSPARTDSPTWDDLEDELDLPSTPDTYEAAQDLIAMMTQFPAPQVRVPVLQTLLPPIAPATALTAVSSPALQVAPTSVMAPMVAPPLIHYRGKPTMLQC